jgi:hypothetical protein
MELRQIEAVGKVMNESFMRHIEPSKIPQSN